MSLPVVLRPEARAEFDEPLIGTSSNALGLGQNLSHRCRPYWIASVPRQSFTARCSEGSVVRWCDVFLTQFSFKSTPGTS